MVLTGNDLLLVASSAWCSVALSWFLLPTDEGRAVRAIAENTERARQLLGIPGRPAVGTAGVGDRRRARRR